MKALITAAGRHGPFNTISRVDGGWMTDGPCLYPDAALGEATVGDWVPPPPTADELNAPVRVAIANLEATVSPRRLREAVTSTAGQVWLAGLDAQIAALRVTLK